MPGHEKDENSKKKRELRETSPSKSILTKLDEERAQTDDDGKLGTKGYT